jgi:hypothetical protein
VRQKSLARAIWFACKCRTILYLGSRIPCSLVREQAASWAEKFDELPLLARPTAANLTEVPAFSLLSTDFRDEFADDCTPSQLDFLMSEAN